MKITQQQLINRLMSGELINYRDVKLENCKWSRNPENPPDRFDCLTGCGETCILWQPDYYKYCPYCGRKIGGIK